jgi:hypothetical protein
MRGERFSGVLRLLLRRCAAGFVYLLIRSNQIKDNRFKRKPFGRFDRKTWCSLLIWLEFTPGSPHSSSEPTVEFLVYEVLTSKLSAVKTPSERWCSMFTTKRRIVALEL